MDEKTREEAINLKIKLLQEKSKNIERRHKLVEEDRRQAESRGNAISNQQERSSYGTTKNYNSHAHMDEPVMDDYHDKRSHQARGEPGYRRKPGGSRGQHDNEHGQGDGHVYNQHERNYREYPSRDYRQDRGMKHEGYSKDYDETRHHQRRPEREDRGYENRRHRDGRRLEHGGQDMRRVEYSGLNRQEEDRYYGNRSDENRPQDKRMMEREKQRRHNIEAMEAQMSGKLQKGDKDWQETGGFLRDPHREGQGEFTKNPPPRNVRYSPNENKGRQQNRNFGRDGKMDRMIDMTGRQRQDYDKWKQQQDEADKERLARSQAEGGQWRRDWDCEKKVDEYEEEPRDRRDYTKGDRRGGRYDRRQERNDYRSGDRPARRHDDERQQERREDRTAGQDNDWNQRTSYSRSSSGREYQRKNSTNKQVDDNRQLTQKSSSNDFGADEDEDWGADTSSKTHDPDISPRNQNIQPKSFKMSKTSVTSKDDDWGQAVVEEKEPQVHARDHYSAHMDGQQMTNVNPQRDNWNQRRDDDRRRGGQDSRRQNDREHQHPGNQQGYQKRDGGRGFQRRDNHSGFQRRDNESEFQRRDVQQGYQKRDDRRTNQRRDNQGGYQRRGDQGGYQRRNDQIGYPKRENQDERKDVQRFQRDNYRGREDRESRNFQNQKRNQRKWSQGSKESESKQESAETSVNPAVQQTVSAIQRNEDVWGDEDWGQEAEDIKVSVVIPSVSDSHQDKDPNDAPEHPDDEMEGKLSDYDQVFEEEGFSSDFDPGNDSSAPDASSDKQPHQLDQTEPQTSKNKGNLKVNIKSTQADKEASQAPSRTAAQRTTSLISPLKTPENFVPVGDWALEVEQSSPNFVQTENLPKIEDIVQQVTSKNEEQLESECQEKELENDQEASNQDSFESSGAQEVTEEKDDVSEANEENLDVQDRNPKLNSSESSDVPETSQDNVLGSSDIKELSVEEEQVSHSEHEGLLSGQEENVDATVNDADPESEKDLYEDLENGSSVVKSDDDDDSFATAGSDQEKDEDTFAYQKLENENTDNELELGDFSLEEVVNSVNLSETSNSSSFYVASSEIGDKSTDNLKNIGLENEVSSEQEFQQVDEEANSEAHEDDPTLPTSDSENYVESEPSKTEPEASPAASQSYPLETNNNELEADSTLETLVVSPDLPQQESIDDTCTDVQNSNNDFETVTDQTKSQEPIETGLDNVQSEENKNICDETIDSHQTEDVTVDDVTDEQAKNVDHQADEAVEKRYDNEEATSLEPCSDVAEEKMTSADCKNDEDLPES